MVMLEYRMTSEAAVMMAQSGDSDASHTPTGDMHAPPMPAASPTFSRHVRFFTWATAPVTDDSTTTNSDVPVHTMGGSMKPSLKMGTSTVPPPMPSMPESTPTTRPTTTDAMTTMTDSMLPY